VEYYNADGTQSFCGNGARSSVAFAKHIGIITDQANFKAIDGLHFAEFLGADVKLEMSVKEKIQEEGEDYSLNTGSPHYCRFDQNEPDIVALGQEIRFSDKYTLEGVNVNTVRIDSKGISVQTYERGVEGETLSCGTGVTACALIAMDKKGLDSPVRVQTKGGILYVEGRVEDDIFKNVFLIGPAKLVFSGSIDV
jgi:diaminopimelate epimerase